MAKQSKKGWLVIKAALVSQASVDADVIEAIKKITNVRLIATPINAKYPILGAWLTAADRIVKRLVVVHGYAAFQLNDKEQKSYHDKTFTAFRNFCREKILGKGAIS